jgi:hypothetical protein
VIIGDGTSPVPSSPSLIVPSDGFSNNQ